VIDDSSTDEMKRTIWKGLIVKKNLFDFMGLEPEMWGKPKRWAIRSCVQYSQ
jgi:hypothetical protein